MRGAIALVIGAFTLVAARGAYAESLGETLMRSDISNGLYRYERAWAAYQLQATTAQYDVGIPVTAATMPTIPADLFLAYKLSPAASALRSFSMQFVAGPSTTAKICIAATLQTPAHLQGFIVAVHDSGALWSDPSCTAGTLNPAISFPTLIYAYKTVAANRAANLIALDSAERAAQTAVSGTITFALPGGNLLDFTTQMGSTSAAKTAILTNSTAGLIWTLSDAVVTDGAFTVAPSGCTGLLPMTSCTLAVSFAPTALGKQAGHVSLTTTAGSTLILRLSGIGTP